MPILSSGSNVTLTVSAGQILTVQSDQAIFDFENPVGTRVGEYGADTVFGPFASGGSVKITSIQGPVYYELGAGQKSYTQFDPSNVDIRGGGATGMTTVSAGSNVNTGLAQLMTTGLVANQTQVIAGQLESGDGDAIYAHKNGTGLGYAVHGISSSTAGSGGGFAADSNTGSSSGVVGNRYNAGGGNGVYGARNGSGAGSGVYGIVSNTSSGSGVQGQADTTDNSSYGGSFIRLGAGNGDGIYGVRQDGGTGNGATIYRIGTGNGQGADIYNQTSGSGHAVQATRMNSGATVTYSQGILGFYDGTNSYGVYGSAPNGTNKFAGYFNGAVYFSSALAGSKAGAVVAGDVPAGQFMVIRDTVGLTTKLYYNNAGALMSVALA